ncbi:MAG: GDSL-type esterase/lipase family protein [Novosphingobium sp.]
MAARSLATALVAALLAVGGAAWWLGREAAPPRGMAANPCPPEAAYKGSAVERIDWAGLCRWRADNARIAASGKRPRVVFLGDSLTEFWGDHDSGFFTQGRVNRGIGGQTSAQQLVRFRQDVVALQPRLVHVMGGINDIAANSGLATPEGYLANFESMIDLAQMHGIGVILGTIPPTGDFDTPGKVAPQPWISGLNRGLRELAARRGLVLADYHAAMAHPDGTPRGEYYADWGHPNAAGYAAMKTVAIEAAARAEGIAPPPR